MNDDQALRDFVAKYARPYDPESDAYDRPPFAADIVAVEMRQRVTDQLAKMLPAE